MSPTKDVLPLVSVCLSSERVGFYCTTLGDRCRGTQLQLELVIGVERTEGPSSR